LVNKKGFQALKKANKNKYLLIKALNMIKNKKSTNKKYINLSKYVTKFYKKVLKKSVRKLQLYFYYKQLLYINRSKFNYTYLQYLKKHLESIYNKNVEFNLVNLNRFYLNSDILSESITLKLTRNRRKMLKYLNNLKNKVKTQKKKIFLGKSVFFFKSAEHEKNSHIKHNLTTYKYLLEKTVLNNLKYRHVTGFRLEAKGRLTRRYTASRSVSKLRYKGNLLNIDSSYRGLSSVLLKGNLKSNVQYTKLKSKTRIGSFGIKG
jgi:ribosomal VAR1-like protein